MEKRAELSHRPLLIRIGLWGIRSRRAAWGFVWLCVALALGSVAFGFSSWFNERWSAGIAQLVTLLCLSGAAAYYACLHWVDVHGRWD